MDIEQLFSLYTEREREREREIWCFTGTFDLIYEIACIHDTKRSNFSDYFKYSILTIIITGGHQSFNRQINQIV